MLTTSRLRRGSNAEPPQLPPPPVNGLNNVPCSVEGNVFGLQLDRDRFRNPLVGEVWPGETRFPDMTEAYDLQLRELALTVAREQRIILSQGVYAALLGPSFETPAEIQLLSRLGADVVGMSTVPEVIAARAGGMRCLGFTLVTNLAAGLSGQPLSHEEVMETGDRSAATLQRLVQGILGELGAGSA